MRKTDVIKELERIHDLIADDEAVDDIVDVRLYGDKSGNWQVAWGDPSYDQPGQDIVFCLVSSLDPRQDKSSEVETAIATFEEEYNSDTPEDGIASFCPGTLFPDIEDLRSRQNVKPALSEIHRDFGKLGEIESIPVTLHGNNWGEWSIHGGDDFGTNPCPAGYWEIRATLDLEVPQSDAVETTLGEFEDCFTHLSSHNHHDAEIYLCKQLWEDA